MKLQNIERKRSQINQSVYGLLAMAIVVFVLIVVVLQFQFIERSKRDEQASYYHLVISEKSMALQNTVDKFRLWFRGYDLERYSKINTINDNFSHLVLNVSLSRRDKIGSFEYEIEKYIEEINAIQGRYAGPAFITIASLLNAAYENVHAALNQLQKKKSFNSSHIDAAVEPLYTVAHQMQLLHQHAYNKMQRTKDVFLKQQRNQLIVLVVVFMMIGLFGMVKMLAIVRRTLSSLVKIQQTLYKQSMIIDQIHDSVISTDISGNITSWNKGSEKLFGYKKSEIFGKSIAIVYPEEDHDFLQNEIISPLREKGQLDLEVRLQRKSGAIFFAHLSLSMLYDEQGDASGMIGYSMDITERKKSQQELINEKNSVQNYLDIAAVMLVAINSEGMVTLVNRKGSKVLGYEENEIIGSNWFDNYLPDNIKKEVFGVFKNLMSGNIKLHEYYEAFILTRKGDTRLISWHNSLLYDDAGKICGTLSSGTDITDIRAAESELEKHRYQLEKLVDERTLELATARDDAERANISKSEFLSRMSHELRTPMNAILGFGQILEIQSEGLNEIQRSNVKEILEAGHHLLSLINDVLDMARIESGRMEVTLEKTIVSDVLQQSLSLIKSQAKVNHIEIIDCLSNKGHIVLADSMRLKQVFVNILSNAVKYNIEEGSITLSSDVVDEQRVRICISDTGEGLTEDEILKLFTSFERLNNTNNVEGTGIGLVISKHLVELMGGLIGVDSVPGEGSVFWLELPLYTDA